MEPEPATEQEAPKRPTLARRLITIGVGIVILLFLLVGAAIAYIYYFGASPTLQSQPAAPKPQTNTTHKAPAVADDAKVGVAVETITSPVVPGDNSYIAIHTLAGSTCTIDVEYNKVKSTDSGLVPKVADEYGAVSWSWTLTPQTPLGSWPVTVTCARNKQSGVVTAQLVVSKTVDQ